MATTEQFLERAINGADNTGAFNVSQIRAALHITDEEMQRHGNALESRQLMACPYKQHGQAEEDANWRVIGDALDEALRRQRSSTEGLTKFQQHYLHQANNGTKDGKFSFKKLSEEYARFRSETQLRQLIELGLFTPVDPEGYSTLTDAGKEKLKAVNASTINVFRPSK